jgi:hypothetical protein
VEAKQDLGQAEKMIPVQVRNPHRVQIQRMGTKPPKMSGRGKPAVQKHAACSVSRLQKNRGIGSFVVKGLTHAYKHYLHIHSPFTACLNNDS